MRGVDKAQWVEQYRVLEKPLYNVVYRLLWDPTESQDIVQEAFLRCWERRADVRADGFRALVFRIALNLARNRRRRNTLWRLVGIDSVDLAHTGADVSAAAEERPIREALDALPDRFRSVLLLTDVAGMTYREAAVVLQVQEGTVGSRRTRALGALRERLERQRRRSTEDGCQR
jgi:RNA polymerase sigma-70 factor (ECF subfamily)